MRTWRRGVAPALLAAAAMTVLAVDGRPARAQAVEVIEVPLRLEDGRILVTAEAPDGSTHDFVLGLGLPVLTESGVARLGTDRGSLTLRTAAEGGGDGGEAAGPEVRTDGAQEVPDRYLAGVDAVGILGGETLNRYDIVIDVPNGRLLMKPSSRTVRWPGIALSSAVPVQVFHDVLIRADVEFGGALVGGLIDLVSPDFEVNEALASAVENGTVKSFRMGYGSWSDLPARVTDNPVLGRWAPEGTGFAIVGASVAYDCAIAISWYHRDLRTCTR